MPRWKDLKRFCEKDGWILYKETDHYFYEKIMPDGTDLFCVLLSFVRVLLSTL